MDGMYRCLVLQAQPMRLPGQADWRPAWFMRAEFAVFHDLREINKMSGMSIWLRDGWETRT